jgi:hypothetical protein
MAERCGSRVAHDWLGYEAVAANRYYYNRGLGSPPIDAVSDRTGRCRGVEGFGNSISIRFWPSGDLP